MSPATTARALAGLNVQRGRPTAAQWVDALAILANTVRAPRHTLHVEFTPGGSARITEKPFR
ncbi:hypothetical protein MKK70_21305 [Methylobacterium sp. E-041]|uniref:hypothetical protein n=1 Tax=Methylobacterium sp. E-041 TaxID=2836573 RepID=UPI001FBA4C3A|nr:hypothetical protein [Methylobacterium sp. E-041]MCJ2107867.1 hypothetical protein [Methylobacterium sp. E-041]